MNALCLLVPALLVLGSVPRALSAEYCHGWREVGGARHRGFRCPERWDGEGARYCCGACALRYCCASPAARLDQSTCPAETDYFSGGAQEIQPSLPTYLPFVIVFSAFLSFVLLGAMISACCCQCVKPKPADERPSPNQTSLLESGGPSPKSSAPSCTSSSGIPPPRPTPSDISVYSAFTPSYVAPIHQGVPQFYPNYPNYPLPPEHTMLIAPAFLDAHSHPHGQPYPQDPVYPVGAV
ncbi:shisa family member 2a [Trichomycterus rosablanca]|uniref:shisa family member 2a n=1 Tax=Trichomycterus rosablanca TaxID=2290929 RepID=UPI002F34F208